MFVGRNSTVALRSTPTPRLTFGSLPRMAQTLITNVGVTPAAKPFDVMVGCNTFEGVAANYGCAIRILT